MLWDLIRSPHHEILLYFSYIGENREIKAYRLNLQIRTPPQKTPGEKIYSI